MAINGEWLIFILTYYLLTISHDLLKVNRFKLKYVVEYTTMYCFMVVTMVLGLLQAQ